MDQGTKQQVLIVEDDPDIREALEMLLDLEGYEAIGAAHGREALDILRAGTRPSVIVLDLMMPVMDGWEFERILEADPDLSMLPVIIITAFRTPFRSTTRTHPIVRKPIDVTQLVEQIKKCSLPVAERKVGGVR